MAKISDAVVTERVGKLREWMRDIGIQASFALGSTCLADRLHGIGRYSRCYHE